MDWLIEKFIFVSFCCCFYPFICFLVVVLLVAVAFCLHYQINVLIAFKRTRMFKCDIVDTLCSDLYKYFGTAISKSQAQECWRPIELLNSLSCVSIRLSAIMSVIFAGELLSPAPIEIHNLYR